MDNAELLSGCALGDIQLVLGQLQRAGLRYAPPVDDQTAALWWEALADVDPAVLMEAAKRWVKDNTEWPAVAVFSEQCRVASNYIGAVRAGLEHPHPGTTCPSCEGTGFVFSDPVREGYNPAALFCPTCRPEEYARQAGGHHLSDHNKAACGDPGCQAVTRRRR